VPLAVCSEREVRRTKISWPSGDENFSAKRKQSAGLESRRFPDEPMADYVLDTSAVLALFRDEEGAQEVEDILDACAAGESVAYLPFMSLMEFEYSTLRAQGLPAIERALLTIHAWPVKRMESSPEWGRKAAKVKSEVSLSIADAWNAALALMLDAELVHKDPEFDYVPELKHRRLPYKKP
jgi:predicted nucleic acid-binding protein